MISKLHCLACFLLAVCLAVTLSCARQNLTSTGAERLFGKNKISDTYYQWKEIEGNHFRIIYPEILRQRALDIAQVYEANLDRIRADLGIQSEQSIPVFIYPSQEEYETTHITSGLVEGSGGFTEFYKERVAFPVHGNRKDLNRLALHEITHAVQLKYLLENRYYRSLQIFFTAILSPLWFMEGVAEYESQAWDTVSAMHVRDAVMDNKLIPLNQLRGFSHLAPHQIHLAYHQSDLFIQFLVEKCGDQCIARLLKLIKNRLNLYKALHQVTGMRPRALFGAWKKYASERLRVGGRDWQDPWREARLLTAKKGWSVYPAYSPDGSQVAFLSDWETEGFYFSLYVLDIGTGRLKKLKKRGLELSSMDWSSDGRYLVFVSDDDNRSDLFLYDLKKNNSERIEQRFSNTCQPTFLPGDKEVGFVATVNGVSDIYKISLSDGGLTPLTQTSNDEAYPSWSQDGGFLVFCREYEEQYDLVLVDTDTGEEERLTSTPHDEISPVFVPGERALIYVSDQDGIYNVHRLDLETGSILPLSKVVGGIFTPRVSPDGQRLLFSYFRHGQYRIFETTLSAEPTGSENAEQS